MKKNLIPFLCLIIIRGLSSCNGDNFIEQTSTVAEQKTSGYISFTYKDVTYSSKYETDGENYRYENPDFIKILNEIQKLPNLAFLSRIDGSYAYYDSYQELCEKEKINIDKEAKVTTRSFITDATLKIYTRTKYRGDSKAFSINTNSPRFYIPDLGVFGLDEQISSMRINGSSFPNIVGYSSCSATFFENKNFQGKSGTFTIIFPNISLGVKDFAEHYFGLSPAPYTLDDITSSIQFYLGAPI